MSVVLNHNIIDKIIKQMHPDVWEIVFWYNGETSDAILCTNREALINRGMIEMRDTIEMMMCSPIYVEELYDDPESFVNLCSEKIQINSIKLHYIHIINDLTEDETKLMYKILENKFREYLDKLDTNTNKMNRRLRFEKALGIKTTCKYSSFSIAVRKIILYDN